MFRKRKNPTPAYRTAVPYGPVRGEHHELRASKPYCRFLLDEALTDTTEKAVATITHQWGPGIAHSFDDKIVVYNLETESPGTYLGDMEAGEAGMALWDTSRKWILIVTGPGSSDDFKRVCRFTLDVELTNSDESVAATITDQYGP